MKRSKPTELILFLKFIFSCFDEISHIFGFGFDWYNRDIGTTKLLIVYEYFLTKYQLSIFCCENKFLIGQSTKTFSVKTCFEELKKKKSKC